MKNNGLIAFRSIKREVIDGDCYGLRAYPRGAISDILDIGANVGLFSLAARFIQPKTRIVAVEPHPMLFEVMSENVKHLDVEPVNEGFGDGEKIGFLSAKERVVLAVRYDKGGSAEATTTSRTVEGFIDTYALDPQGLFLKIDCEGAEKLLFENEKEACPISKCVGVGLELHDINGPTIKEWKRWIIDRFIGTHTILFKETSAVRGQVRMFRYDIPLLFTPLLEDVT